MLWLAHFFLEHKMVGELHAIIFIDRKTAWLQADATLGLVFFFRMQFCLSIELAGYSGSKSIDCGLLDCK